MPDDLAINSDCLMTSMSIYLDGHSTTPLAPQAATAMEPWWHTQAGNPHSPHLRGLLASQATEHARTEVASLVGADSQELFFTSGATEANNIAIRGIALAATAAAVGRNEIVVSAIEHKSILASAQSLAALGYTIVVAPVTRTGVIDVERLATLVGSNTLLVSTMAVNNEVGSIQPLSAVVEIARGSGALVHVDAAQAVGKLPMSFADFDLASISSHKMYGPMGVGALFVSSASYLRPMPITFGGNQEGGLRPGTLPTPLVVGFGMAAKVAQQSLSEDSVYTNSLVSLLIEELRKRQVYFVETVPTALRVPGSLSIRIPGSDAMTMIGKAGDRLFISEGSACNSGQISPSHVLSSMGYSPKEASETFRMYCSKYNTRDEMIEAARIVAEISRR